MSNLPQLYHMPSVSRSFHRKMRANRSSKQARLATIARTRRSRNQRTNINHGKTNKMTSVIRQPTKRLPYFTELYCCDGTFKNHPSPPPLSYKQPNPNSQLINCYIHKHQLHFYCLLLPRKTSSAHQTQPPTSASTRW